LRFPEPAASLATYRASTDFSAAQGQSNWYYLDSNGTPMSYISANSWWQGQEGYNLLWSSGGHPGNYADAMRQWRAPSAGSVHITGNAADGDPGGGDGVIVTISKGSTVLWQQTIANGNTAGVNYDLTTSVAAGRSIFGVRPAICAISTKPEVYPMQRSSHRQRTLSRPQVSASLQESCSRSRLT
jgi:hypothetical protein